MSEASRPAGRRLLRDQVYVELSRQITDGTLAPGAQLRDTCRPGGDAPAHRG